MTIISSRRLPSAAPTPVRSTIVHTLAVISAASGATARIFG
jgi:hypothetical protein